MFILIYLIKRASFLPVLINVRFAAHGARHKVLFPSRNQDTLVYTLRTRRTDPVVNCHHYLQSQQNSIIWTCTHTDYFLCTPLPSSHRLPVSVLQQTKRGGRCQRDSLATVPPNSHPFPRLRPRRLPIQDSCLLHKGSSGWSLSS